MRTIISGDSAILVDGSQSRLLAHHFWMFAHGSLRVFVGNFGLSHFGLQFCSFDTLDSIEVVIVQFVVATLACLVGIDERT